MSNNLEIRSIGVINPSSGGFLLQLDQAYAPGLRGLEAFSHALVFWWAHRADSAAERARLVYTKPYTKNPDDVGVFGTRSPSRPNPIGVSVVSITSLNPKLATIVTPYIDTEPGTPIIDLKPYYPASDRVVQVQTPEWCQHWPQTYEESATFDWAAEFE